MNRQEMNGALNELAVTIGAEPQYSVRLAFRRVCQNVRRFREVLFATADAMPGAGFPLPSDVLATARARCGTKRTVVLESAKATPEEVERSALYLGLCPEVGKVLWRPRGGDGHVRRRWDESELLDLVRSQEDVWLREPYRLKPATEQEQTGALADAIAARHKIH